jgi:AraC-like DNA-binding protein
MLTAYPDMSIKDVAGYLGFSDQFYFSKVFRSLIGLSPSEYKSQADGK